MEEREGLGIESVRALTPPHDKLGRATRSGRRTRRCGRGLPCVATGGPNAYISSAHIHGWDGGGGKRRISKRRRKRREDIV